MKSLWVRTVLICIGLLVFYFFVPIKPSAEGQLSISVRIAVSALVLLGLAYGIQRLLVRQISQPGAPLDGLVIGVITGTLLFNVIVLAGAASYIAREATSRARARREKP